jgi:peroxiredoxin (alkyl hydroperoxide reductase subunit C)
MGVFVRVFGLHLFPLIPQNFRCPRVIAEIHDDGIGRDAPELLRKVQAAQYVAAHPGQVCPAKWTPGAETLAPSLDLVGKI